MYINDDVRKDLQSNPVSVNASHIYEWFFIEVATSKIALSNWKEAPASIDFLQSRCALKSLYFLHHRNLFRNIDKIFILSYQMQHWLYTSKTFSCC